MMVLKYIGKNGYQTLCEAYLQEDLNAAYEFYKNKLSREDFDKLIALDPTFNAASNKLGNYGKWILTRYLDPKSDVAFTLYRVKDCLSDFEEVKNELVNRDIMRFKSLEDISNYLNDDASYKEKSHRQEVRARQKTRRSSGVPDGAELVYEDDNWEVWIPHTYEASCKLGRGTEWCTATTEGDQYYNYYKKAYGGDYYININKKNRDKYQFHFESEQFQYKTGPNKEVSLNEFFIQTYPASPGLYRFYAQRFPLKDFGVMTEAQIKAAAENHSLELVYTKHDSNSTEARARLCHAHRIVIDHTVSELDAGIFSRLPVVEVDMSQSNISELPESVFEDCEKLQKVLLPEGLEEIGPAAFQNCNALVSIDPIHCNVGANAFSWCTSLPEIVIEAEGEAVEIAEDAFAYCHGLKNVSLTNVEIIGRGAFSHCEALTTVNINASPGSVEVMDCAFAEDSQLANIDMQAFFYIRPCAFRGTALAKAIFSDELEAVGDRTFIFCPNLKTVKIAASTYRIGYRAFMQCANLTTLSWADGVDWNSFVDAEACFNTGIVSLRLPDGLSRLSADSFGSCHYLKVVSIPTSLNMDTIAKSFRGSSNLTTVEYRGTKAEWLAAADRLYDGAASLADKFLEAFGAGDAWTSN